VKRNLAVLFFIAIVTAVIGACGATSTPATAIPTGATAPSASTAPSQKAIRIVMIPGSLDDYYNTVVNGAKEEAAKLGITLEVQIPPRQDVSEHTQVLRAVIASKPDAILYAPTDAVAMESPIKEALTQGIKVVTFDADLADPTLRSTYVSADIEVAGGQAATKLLELTGGKGPILYLQDATGQTFHDSLAKGFAKVMAANAGAEMLPVQLTRSEPARAESVTRATLTAHPDLAGIFAGILLDQQGVVPALTAAGKIGAVKTVGFDGTPAGVQYLKDGQLDAIVSVEALAYGVKSVDAAVDAINGKTLDSLTFVNSCVLTATNLSDPENQPCLYQKAPTG
jgi:ribose transport system substrate-binding protein